MQITENVQIAGSLSVGGQLSGANRSSIDQETSKVFPIELMSFRIWDSVNTVLSNVATPGADDLAFFSGAFGTGLPYIRSQDCNAAGAFTGYARSMFTLPPEYDPGAAASIRLAAGMLTSVASVSATVDVQAYKSGRNTLVSGTDLITTVAQSCNSLTFAEKEFVLTPAGLAPGDVLDIRIAIIGNSATASAHHVAIAHVEALLTIRG